MAYPLQLVILVSMCGLMQQDQVILRDAKYITVHVLNILGQLLLFLLAVTTVTV